MAMDDLWGNIYIADKNAHAIRKVTPDGRIFTVAGTHILLNPNTGGFDGDGIATQKRLCFPNGLFVFPDGTFYFIETGDNLVASPAIPSRIRKVDRAGNMTTLYTDAPLDIQRGLWVSPDETFLYFTTNKRLKRWNASNPGNPTTLMDISSDGSADLANIDVAPNGDILVTDRGNHRVYRVPPTANSLTNPVTAAGNGQTDPTQTGTTVLAREGQLATNIPLEEVRGIAFHSLGGYVVASHKGGDLWYVDQANVVHLILQGDRSGSNKSGDGQGVTINRTTLKIAEPRSVRVGWNGDVIICTNDAGFIRVVRSLCARTELPTSVQNGQIIWPGTAGKGYFIERSTSLAPGSWTTLERRRATTAGPQAFVDLSDAFLPRAFYRVHEHRYWPQ